MIRSLAAWTCILGLAFAAEPQGAGAEKITAPASESNPAVPAPGHSVHGEAFDDGPRSLATRLPGMGKIHFAVSTAKPDAQAFIDQGVAQLHSFYYFESERSFRQAASIDPDCAMAYWGLAMSNVNNEKRARAFLKEAHRREAKLTPREKLYLAALDALYKEGNTEKARKKEHLQALETIVQDFPADIDARAWLAMVTWQNSSADGIGSRQAIDMLIDSVQQVEPTHPGAHHYRIHLWDSAKQSRAERAAGLYASSAPGIAHAWHMPGHTYTSLKRYADAAYQQEGSARVDHAAMLRDEVMPFEIHNYAHNNQWLATSLSHIGRVHEALAVARNLVEQPRDPKKNTKTDGGSAQRSGRARWAEILTRYELWDDLIAATTSGALDWSDLAAERKERAYTLGLAYAAKGDRKKLGEHLSEIRAIATEESKSGSSKSSSATEAYSWDHASPATQAALAELEGYEKLANGEVTTAFERFAKATAMRPEAIARAHLVARNFGFAEESARKAVEKQPNQVPPLAALVEVLLATGKPSEAKDAYRKLVVLARTADRDLPVFQRLQPAIAKWKAEGGASPNDAPQDSANDEAAAHRINLATLGPLGWAPTAARPFTLNDTDDHPWSLEQQKGKNVVLLLYLGGQCAHCMQQLEQFGKEVKAFQALNTVVVAVGTDDVAKTKALKNNAAKIAFPMPLLANPNLDVFKTYRAFDDFEGHPLHGTFLIDANGGVRYLRVSAEPFLDVDFLKTEVTRINQLLRRENRSPQ